MQADAYRRARTQLSSRRGFVTARILGAVQSLLVLALLGVIALFVALMASRGEVRFPSARVSLLPQWVTGRMTGEDQQYLLFDDTGIFPLIAGNLLSETPPLPAGAPLWERISLVGANLLSGSYVHRAGAWALDRLTRLLPPLRNNLGALVTLLAIGLALLVLLAGLAQWRSRNMASAAAEVATSLRRQIHRQMYRLGQSSLPTEGTGPVINLWTREVNDIRDGLVDDLDVTPRTQILAAGLLLMALVVSPILTVFLGSFGLLVWITARVLESRCQGGLRNGLARRFGAAMSPPRRSGAAPHRPRLWGGRLR